MSWDDINVISSYINVISSRIVSWHCVYQCDAMISFLFASHWCISIWCFYWHHIHVYQYDANRNVCMHIHIHRMIPVVYGHTNNVTCVTFGVYACALKAHHSNWYHMNVQNISFCIRAPLVCMCIYKMIYLVHVHAIWRRIICVGITSIYTMCHLVYVHV